MSGKISVIVPVYNIEKYIGECLESLLNQTYKDLEIILVDDGSKDNSGRLCDNYAAADKRIKVVHQKNGGVSVARNAGLEAASGDYIGFCDGDDWVEPELYQTLLENMLESDADISHCAFQYVKKDKAIPFYGTCKKEVQDRTKGIVELLKGSYIEPGLWTKLFKRETLGSIRFDASVKYNEDLLFNFLVFCRADKLVYEDKVLYNYRSRENSAAVESVWGAFSKKAFLDTLNVAQIIWDNCACEVKDIKIAALNKYVNNLAEALTTAKREKAVSYLKKDLKASIKACKRCEEFSLVSRKTKIKLKLAYGPYWFYKLSKKLSGAKASRWES